MTANRELETTGEGCQEIIRHKVNAMRFGTVQIVVHEGQVTQVESTEKTRLAGIPGKKTPGSQQV